MNPPLFQDEVPLWLDESTLWWFRIRSNYGENGWLLMIKYTVLDTFLML